MPEAARGRRQLLLWAAMVVVALSLLAMHQLSGNHVAADPTPSTAAHLGAASAQGATFAHQTWGTGHGHARPTAAAVDRSAPMDAGCHACGGGHQAMALTCLAALALLVAGWPLRGPQRRRDLISSLRVPISPSRLLRRWARPPLSLVQLSVSRT